MAAPQGRFCQSQQPAAARAGNALLEDQSPGTDAEHLARSAFAAGVIQAGAQCKQFQPGEGQHRPSAEIAADAGNQQQYSSSGGHEQAASAPGGDRVGLQQDDL